jgi:hypothetical protein
MPNAVRPCSEHNKFLSAWRFVEVARYVPSLKRVIRDKENDLPLIMDYCEVVNYAKKYDNTRYIHFCLAL